MSDQTPDLKPKAVQVSTIQPLEAWSARADQLRQQEWEMAQKLLAISRALLRRISTRDEFKASLAEISRMLDLASRLGRLATGLATDHQQLSGPAGNPIPIDITVALDRIYGPSVSAPHPAVPVRAALNAEP